MRSALLFTSISCITRDNTADFCKIQWCAPKERALVHLKPRPRLHTNKEKETLVYVWSKGPSYNRSRIWQVLGLWTSLGIKLDTMGCSKKVTCEEIHLRYITIILPKLMLAWLASGTNWFSFEANPFEFLTSVTFCLWTKDVTSQTCFWNKIMLLWTGYCSACHQRQTSTKYTSGMFL